MGEALHLVAAGDDRPIAKGDLHFTRASDLGPARIAFTGGGLCEFDDRAAADALFDQLGHRRTRAERLALRTRHAVAATIGFVLIVAALYQWAIPWIADVAVAAMPARWDVLLGDHVLETLDREGFKRPSTLPPAQQRRLRDAFDTLRWPGAAPRVSRPVEFRRTSVPNAFALPGGTIVLTDALVELAGDDDLALLTVLAHEAGHVTHRDVMRQLTRSTITSALAAWYLGDVSSAFAIAAGGIGTMRYSRAAEHEADLYALETMRLNHLPTQPAAELFRRLQTWTIPKPQPVDPQGASSPKPKPRRIEAPEYFSTHPATGDRIRLFETGHE